MMVKNPLEALNQTERAALDNFILMIEAAIDVLTDPAIKAATERDEDATACLSVLEFGVIEFLECTKLPECPLFKEAVLVHVAAKFGNFPPANAMWAETLAWHEHHRKTSQPAEVLNFNDFARKITSANRVDLGSSVKANDEGVPDA